VLILLFLLCSTSPLLSQFRQSREEEQPEEIYDEDYPPPVIDTTKFVMDTVGLNKPMKNHTRMILGDYSPYKRITKRDIIYNSHYTFSEVFKSKRIGYPASLGFPGMNNSLCLAGSFLAGTNIRLGGNNLNDFETGTANLSLIPVQAFESAEIFLGSDAVIFGINSTGSLVNIQEVIHNSYVPYTKLWYSQGGYDMIAADGSFSQNFAKNFNLDLGFRSLNSPGRYGNQKLNTWNLRAKVRWAPSEFTNISFSENYTNYGVGENGGNSKEYSQDFFDEIYSYPVLGSSSRIFRHNMNLNISTYLDSSRHIGIISNTAFVHTERNFRDYDYMFYTPADSISRLKYNTNVISNRTQLETSYGPVGLITGEEISFNSFEKNNYFGNKSYFNFALFGLGKINLFEAIELSGGARYYNQFGNNAISIGAKIKIKIDSNRVFFGDISKSDRLPSVLEGKNINPEHHYLILAGLDWLIGNFKIELLGFARQVDLPINFAFPYDTVSKSYQINYSNASNMRIFGFEGNFDYYIKQKIFFFSFVKAYFSQYNSEAKNVLPSLYSGIKSFYQIKAGKSILNLGLEYELLYGGGGMSYFPGYSANYFIDDKAVLMGNGINLFAEGKLGEAYLKASFNNVLGQNYYFVPYYPELGRNFNFTFTWAFLN
jgi:outer membrane cobalamin receptor